MTLVVEPRRHAAAKDTVYRPTRPVDLLTTVGVLRRGGTDPTMLVHAGTVWMAFHTLGGIATLALRSSGTEISATAWGPGAGEALDRIPALCGAGDDDEGFDPSLHPLVADSARRNDGLRLARTDRLFDALAAAILEQKVTSLQAFGAWRFLVNRYGERAPGPTPRQMYTAPDAETWRLVPSWVWHRAGVEPSQSKTISRAAARSTGIDRALRAASTGPDRDAILTSLPGIGPWTAAETRARALGDPDAVSVGDFHLAHEVGYALTGSRTDDEGMLCLLAPWSGHRQRVIRLIRASGIAEPRRAPRLAPHDHRRI